MDQNQPPTQNRIRPALAAADARLSYKFQRLREKLRQAISSGELHGKLPGERQLARRFRVNAKTLSKALTDLAAEGLLERSIGRGTFVRGSNDAAIAVTITTVEGAPYGAHSIAATSSTPAADRWLIVCDDCDADDAVVRAILAANPHAQIVHDTTTLRPSFLSGFKSLIDFGSDTPVSFLRDMMVRNVSVVIVGREPTTYSMNAVLVDRTLGATRLARDLMLAGHRQFVAIERQGNMMIADAIRRAAQRYAPDATVDAAYPEEAMSAIEVCGGATALICDSIRSATTVAAILKENGIELPARVSLAAVDAGDGNWPCSGYFVSAQEKADAILQALRDGASRRPATLWLAGTFFDAGTTGPTKLMRTEFSDDPETVIAASENAPRRFQA